MSIRRGDIRWGGGATEEELQNMQEWEDQMSLIPGKIMQALCNMGPLILTIDNSLVMSERER